MWSPAGYDGCHAVGSDPLIAPRCARFRPQIPRRAPRGAAARSGDRALRGASTTRTAESRPYGRIVTAAHPPRRIQICLHAESRTRPGPAFSVLFRFSNSVEAVFVPVDLRRQAGQAVELLDEVALGGIGQLVGDIHLGIAGITQHALRHVDLPRPHVVADGDPHLLLEDPGEVGGRDLDGLRHVLHGDPLGQVRVNIVDGLRRLAGGGVLLFPRQHPPGVVQDHPVQEILHAFQRAAAVHLIDRMVGEAVGLLQRHAVGHAEAGEHEGDLDEVVFQIRQGIVGKRRLLDKLQEGVFFNELLGLADVPVRHVAAKHQFRAWIPVNAGPAAVVRHGLQPFLIRSQRTHSHQLILNSLYWECIS